MRIVAIDEGLVCRGTLVGFLAGLRHEAFSMKRVASD